MTDAKRCSKCGFIRDANEFPSDSRNKDGLQSRCRICKNEEGRKAYAEGRFKPLTPEQRKRTKFKQRYGITPEQFQDMFDLQQGGCLICEKNMVIGSRGGDAASVDHHHINGRVRGLLCRRCNSALGYFRDDPAVIEKAIKYLEK